MASTLASDGVDRVLVDATVEEERIDLRVRSQGGMWSEHLAAAVLESARQATVVLASDLAVSVDTTGFRTTTATAPVERLLPADTERILGALRAVAASALAGLPLADVLAHLASSARRLVGADLATVVRADGDEVVVVAVDGVHAEELEGVRLPRLGSLAGQVMATGRTVTIDDAQSDEGANGEYTWMGFGASVLVPLWGEGAGLGTLVVAKLAGGGSFDAASVALLSVYASHTSLVVQRAEDRHRLETLARVTEREALAEGLRERIITRLFEIGLAVDSARSRVEGPAADRLAQVSQDVDELVADIRKHIFGL